MACDVEPNIHISVEAARVQEKSIVTLGEVEGLLRKVRDFLEQLAAEPVQKTVAAAIDVGLCALRAAQDCTRLAGQHRDDQVPFRPIFPAMADRPQAQFRLEAAEDRLQIDEHGTGVPQGVLIPAQLVGAQAVEAQFGSILAQHPLNPRCFLRGRGDRDGLTGGDLPFSLATDHQIAIVLVRQPGNIGSDGSTPVHDHQRPCRGRP